MMDEMYGLHPTVEYSEQASLSPGNLFSPMDCQSFLSAGVFRDRVPIFAPDQLFSAAPALSEDASVTPEIQRRVGDDGITAARGVLEDELYEIKVKIASHPCYPRLLEAYIDCQKVGAPEDIALLLDEVQREYFVCKRNAVSSCLGADPELDQFMETYCDMLVKYKTDLSRPFDEATTFLTEIQMQLRNLCKGPSRNEAAGSSEDDFSGGEIDAQEVQPRDEERELKDRLLRKYSGYISSLKHEFSKKKKKGKLPKEARQTLLDWWNIHYKWPYPTEADKLALAELTGLDQKQINNWFINQRKRHWKPSESMQFDVMESFSGPFFMGD
ncbi:PREDICTED: homeobox protein knotted-1-like 6 isoform X2 [Nelumbo nucifera]|uniref:Homeobox protein knotted-1-like 6 isoform X2 n=2 Tax=Nelumbo nucifera TaxID=4432 RepID=A0A1U7ZC80_NELNU|nr:PREDICTED: homeobox protein knotted-1-like 6 isoform X2 [Nelumbo nucifera]DAD34531.1 TPA_asm: hypothetical protein HUJ06_005171 [Nelumbo nucifera]